MQKLVQGLHHFQQHVFGSKKELFERLKQGQTPEALLITCSDSRIDPNLLTQTEPGDVFVIRNAGNIVPPADAPTGGESATIEYAVEALGIRDIIVCGHSHCGAMSGLLHPETLSALPEVAQWLSHANATRDAIEKNYSHLPESEKLSVAIQENVLVQLENIRTLPCVASRLANGELNLHGWVYTFETGEVFAYDPQQEQFIPLLKPSPSDSDPFNCDGS